MAAYKNLKFFVNGHIQRQCAGTDKKGIRQCFYVLGVTESS